MSVRKKKNEKYPETAFEIALRNRMRDERIRREMTTLEVAFKMGCSQATVSRIECGRQAIQLSYLVRYAQLLRLDTDYFLRWHGEDQEVSPADEERMITDLLKFFNYLKNNQSLLNTASPSYKLVLDLHQQLKLHDPENFSRDNHCEPDEACKNEDRSPKITDV